MSENANTYGLVHLRELDDDAVRGGLAETLEARFAREALGCERVGPSLQRIEPGVPGPVAHRHESDEDPGWCA